MPFFYDLTIQNRTCHTEPYVPHKSIYISNSQLKYETAVSEYLYQETKAGVMKKQIPIESRDLIMEISYPYHMSYFN